MFKIIFIKDRHCTLITNELQKFQQEHHRIIMENNNMISKLTKELNVLQKNKQTDSNNFDEVVKLNNQLIECSKQNQVLNTTLKNLTVSEKNCLIIFFSVFF